MRNKEYHKLNLEYDFIISERSLKNYLLIILCTLSVSFYSQITENGINKRMKDIRDADYKQTITQSEAIKIVTQCYLDSKKIEYENGIKSSGIFLTVLYTNKHDYTNAIRISNEIEDLIKKSTDYRNTVEFYRAKGSNYTLVGLLDDGYKEFLKAIKTADYIKNNDDKHYMKSVVYLDLSSYHSQTVKSDEDSVLHYTKKALAEGEKISENSDLAKKGEKNDWIINLNYFLGEFYLSCSSPDVNKARIYYEKARKIYETSKTKMLLGNEIAFLAYLCKFYNADKKYNEAIKFGLKSIELEKREEFPISRKIAYQNLANAYLQIGERENYQKYINQYIALNDSINISEKKKASTSLEKIIDRKQAESEKNSYFLLYFGLIILFLILGIFLFFWRKNNRKLHNNYLSIIEKIKSEEKTETIKTESVPVEKSLNISDETINKILAKLERFEKNNGFIKKDITISYLSNQFKTNPKTLSSVIKSLANKNFNSYINDLRINYIIRKLYEDKMYREFKINYLAEECGYSSPKVFILAFKKNTGVTPSYYITNLKKTHLKS